MVVVDSFTGNIVNTPNCPGGHTYAFYRTPEERARVEEMWLKAGFVPVATEQAPESFQQSGQPSFICLRRMSKQELGQEQQLQRESVVTIGSSV